MTIRMIIFLILTVSHRVLPQKRLVENTNCLELAKPSNQQLRLICSENDYHCLLDETFTKEFEVCTEWRWILGGKCAYFNTYGSGNIDERNCIQKHNLTCSTVQFSSAANTNHTACYVKKEISTSSPSTISPTRTQAVKGTRSVTGTSDKGNTTTITTTSDKHCQRDVHFLPIIFGISGPLVSVVVISFIFMHLKYVPLYRKAYPVENQESIDRVRNENTVEEQPFLRIETEDTSENPTTMRDEDEIMSGARKSVISDSDVPEDLMDESDLSGHFEDAVSSPTSNKQINFEVSADKHQKGDSKELRTNKVASDTCKSAEVDNSENFKEGVSTADVPRKKLGEEKSEENASGVCIDSDKSDNEDGDTQELTDVFDDTVESLQRIAHPTDEQDKELCIELFNLLATEGLKLTQEVIAATIIRESGKSVKTLIDQEKSKLQAMLPEEIHRILESPTERDTLFHVSYGLHRIILDEEKSPKSGWGNPVRERDIGIGDDVDRLYRIQNIVRGISNQETVSVEDYIRLLDIMIEALARLDPYAEFKEDFKLLSYKLKSIKNPNLTQTMLKTITDTLKKNVVIF